MKTKDCKICKKRWSIEEFFKSPAYKDGYQIRCKSCIRKYDEERIKNHKGPPTTGIKICSFCKIEKDIKEFTKNLRSRDGLKHACKTCNRKREHQYRTKNPNQRYLNMVWQKYGLEPEIYLKILKQQDFKCKICGDSTRLGVDHCHISLKIRGLLCVRCNTGIGMFKDDISNLENAIKYLKGQ